MKNENLTTSKGIKTYFAYTERNDENTKILWQEYDCSYKDLDVSKMYSSIFAYEINDGVFTLIKSKSTAEINSEQEIREQAEKYIQPKS